jgi:hypothetical protein
MTYCRSRRKYLFIGCDIQTHHTVWGAEALTHEEEAYLLHPSIISVNSATICTALVIA